MPVFPIGSWLQSDDTVATGAVAAGRFSLPSVGARFDRHFHDDDEIWFIATGSARIVVDGGEHDVSAGDIVVHPAGTVHDIVAVYEPLSGFFVESGHPAGGRSGHQHVSEVDAAGHDVASEVEAS